MAEAKLKLKAPITELFFDLDENSLELNDYVKVLRCKDCKWSVEYYDFDGNVPYWVCKNWDGDTDADGFCHEAELKE